MSIRKNFMRLFTFLLVFLFATPSLMTAGKAAEFSDKGIEPSTEEMYGYLLSVGIPESFLLKRSTDSIARIYEKCYGKTIEYGGTTSSYYYDGEASPFATILPADMTLDISTLWKIGHDSAGHNIREECYVFIYYEWLNSEPDIRKTDALQVDWDNSVFSYAGDFYHADYSDGSDRFSGRPYSSVNYPAFSAQSELAYYAYLDLFGTNLIGETDFTLIPVQNPMYPSGSTGNFRTTSLNVRYIHDGNPLPFVQGFSIGYEGYGISVTLDSFAYERSDSHLIYYKNSY